VRGATNALIAAPIMASILYDYTKSLRGLEYKSEEYGEKRAEVHESERQKAVVVVEVQRRNVLQVRAISEQHGRRPPTRVHLNAARIAGLRPLD